MPPAESWPVTLPVYGEEVFDNSQVECHDRCPRLYFYRYVLRRGPVGSNFPIGFGIAYHKYREVIEDLMRDEGSGLTDEIHTTGVAAAFEGWEDPPLGHRHEHLNATRLKTTLEAARDRVRREIQQGKMVVVRAEDSFDLEMGFTVCPKCGEAYWEETDDFNCLSCGALCAPARHGGRMDQVIDWKGRLWVRDFKTTGRMGKTYPNRFDPNNQITGYVWAGSQLSGRQLQGAVIEVVYNTKRNGPEFHQFLSTRSPGQVEQWLEGMFTKHSRIRRSLAEIESRGYNAFPQNTAACDDFGGCYFRGACTQDSAWALENWLERETQYSHWDFTDPDKEESES